MYRLSYLPSLIWHLFRFSLLNRSYGLLVITIIMIGLSFIMIAAQVSAPFIYTLF